MSRKYDLSNHQDIEILNHVLNRYGIHLEKDLFGQPYIWLEHKAYFPEKYLVKEFSKPRKSRRVRL